MTVAETPTQGLQPPTYVLNITMRRMKITISITIISTDNKKTRNPLIIIIIVTIIVAKKSQ